MCGAVERDIQVVGEYSTPVRAKSPRIEMAIVPETVSLDRAYAQLSTELGEITHCKRLAIDQNV
jgi:hypothetical protein